MSAIVYLLLMVASTDVAASEWLQTVDHCFLDSGKVLKGELNQADANVYEIRKEIRSKVECATYCYADRERCKTAVYKPSGACWLITNFTDTLNIRESSSGWQDGSIIEMKVNPQTFSGCNCTGTSICLQDCQENRTISESGCMEVNTTQYDDGCGFEPYIQSVEYFLNNLDVESSTNGHTFFTVTYVKKYDWSTLRVKWRGSMRAGYGAVDSWGRWSIKFNGVHCGNPGWIEGINYNHESDTSHHKTTGIHGICYDLAAQSYSITLNGEVHVSTQMYVGYRSYNSRFYVDEISQRTWTEEPPVAACPHLPVFNIREHITADYSEDEPQATLWNFGYTKMEDDTWLRINADIVMRLATFSDVDICISYHIQIDGEECAPHALGKTLAYLEFSNQVGNEHRSSEFEGHCSGITKGYHNLSLHLAHCNWGTYDTGDAYTGWNSCRQRIIIEEFRTGTNTVAVADKTGTMYRIPQFNIFTYGEGHISSGVNNGIVWTIPDYNKLYVFSGLRLTLSTNGRSYSGHQSSSYSTCCRHYFLINGEECEDSGTIEGIHALNKWTNIHRSIMIEGTCHGIPNGKVTLTVNAGICKDETLPGECYFGWNSWTHLMVSETYTETVIQNY